VEERKIEDQPVVMTAMLKGIEKEERVKGEASVLADTTLRHQELSLASEMIDHLAAGFETSGIALTYISYYLSINPKVQDTLREELKTLDCDLKDKDAGTGRLPDFKELDKLPFLNAVVTETLRLRASIPGNQPRMTPFPSCTIGPYTNIPGGIRVGSQAHSVHRNEEVFEDPESWKPMRCLENSSTHSGDEEKHAGEKDEKRKEMDRWFWAFSSGGRMCVGSHFALHGESCYSPLSTASDFKSAVQISGLGDWLFKLTSL
jgi:cytochrome P450